MTLANLQHHHDEGAQSIWSELNTFLSHVVGSDEIDLIVCLMNDLQLDTTEDRGREGSLIQQVIKRDTSTMFKIMVSRADVAPGTPCKIGHRRTPGTLFDLALSQLHLEAVQYFLKLGADANGVAGSDTTPLLTALQSEHTDLRMRLAFQGMAASTHKNSKESGKVIAVVKVLLSSGAAVTNEALHAAVTRLHPEVVELFIKLGADVHFPNAGGDTPLVALLRCDRSGRSDAASAVEAIAKRLVDAGAKVGLTDSSGSTPLHYACKLGLRELVPYFIRHGADANALDRIQRTPLSYAKAKQGCYNNVRDEALWTSIVDDLLKLGGANPNRGKSESSYRRHYYEDDDYYCGEDSDEGSGWD